MKYQADSIFDTTNYCNTMSKHYTKYKKIMHGRLSMPMCGFVYHRDGVYACVVVNVANECRLGLQRRLYDYVGGKYAGESILCSRESMLLKLFSST